MLLVALCLLAVDPITPGQLKEALAAPPTGDAARALAEQIRAAAPKGIDPRRGLPPLIEKDLVAFVIEGPESPTPRIEGMVNHGRGWNLIRLGETGFWARIESIPTDTKFSYRYRAGDRELRGGEVEMPDWSYPPESKQRPGVKYGEYYPLRFRSKVYNNDRTGWIYLLAAYETAEEIPALMVFQDGDAYKREQVGTVVDNLIADKKMPVTVLILLNPGVNDDGSKNRSVEYDTLSDRYAQFLETEVLPRVAQEVTFSDDPRLHAIAGASSGGICAFTVAWQRPNLFGRVCSQIGSFTNIRGGHVYPDLVRREPKRAIKIVLTDGDNDLINQYGDWWQANQALYAALKEKGYDVSFLADHGFHAFWTCGRQLPEALRRTWEDVVEKKD
ncbi:MAG: esterase family protein [Isosphaeraceae bacterium]|nr:esterase family protein [Isosphaeraceae bacterium]